MKAFLLVLLLAVSARGGWIIVTQDAKLANGLTSHAGEVEETIADGGTAWVIKTPAGGKTTIAKAACAEVTADDAARALMAYVQKLYAEMDAAAPAQGETSTDRYYARKAERDARQRQELDDASKAAQVRTANELNQLNKTLRQR
jgi:hypothetical protein